MTTPRSRIAAVVLAALVGSALLGGCAPTVAERPLRCPVVSVGRVRADYPEVNVVAALEQAAVAAGRDNGRGTLVFSDSGLSTTGALNFTQPGLLEAPPAEVIAFLEREHELPNLKGLSVFLVLEPTEPPQDDLGHYRANVKDLLQMIAEKGGAACVAVAEEPATASGPHLDHLPPVSLVRVPRAAVFSAPCSGVLNDTGDVGFNPGLATFIEPAKAHAVLEPVGRALRDRTCNRIVLTGTTARDGSLAYQRDLAQQRAKAVKQVLVTEDGVDPASIEIVGLGSYFTKYQPDIGPHGELLPGPAQLNRTVRIDPCTPTCPSYELK